MYRYLVLALITFIALSCKQTADQSVPLSAHQAPDEPSLTVTNARWNEGSQEWKFDASIVNTSTNPIDIVIDGDTSTLPKINFMPNYMTVELDEGNDQWIDITRPSDGIPFLYRLPPGREVKMDIAITSGLLKQDLRPGDTIRITYSGYQSQPIHIPEHSPGREK